MKFKKNFLTVFTFCFLNINLLKNISNTYKYNNDGSFCNLADFYIKRNNLTSNIPSGYRYFTQGEELITDIKRINPRISIQNNEYFLNVPTLEDYVAYEYHESDTIYTRNQIIQQKISQNQRYYYILYKMPTKYPYNLTVDDFDVYTEPAKFDYRVWIEYKKQDEVSYCYNKTLSDIIKGIFTSITVDQYKTKLVQQYINELNSHYFEYKTAILDLQEAFNKGYILNNSVNINTYSFTPKFDNWYQIKYKRLENSSIQSEYLAFKTKEEAISTATNSYIEIAKSNQQNNYQLKSETTGIETKYYYSNVKYLDQVYDEIYLYDIEKKYNGSNISNMNDIYVIALPSEENPVAIPVSFGLDTLEKSIKNKILNLDEKEYGVITCSFSTPYSDRKKEFRKNDVYYDENYIIDRNIYHSNIFANTQYYYLSKCFYKKKNMSESDGILKLYSDSKITDEGIYSFYDYNDRSNRIKNGIIYSSDLTFTTYSSNSQLNNQLLNSSYVYQVLNDTQQIDIAFNYFDSYQVKVFKDDEYITTFNSQGGYLDNSNIKEKYIMNQKAIYRFEVYNRLGDYKTYTINTKEKVSLSIDDKTDNSNLILNLKDEGNTSKSIYIYEKIDDNESINEKQYTSDSVEPFEPSGYTLINDKDIKSNYTFSRNDKKTRYFYIVINSKTQSVEPVYQLITWYYKEEPNLTSKIDNLTIYENETIDLTSLGFNFNYGNDKLNYSLEDPSYGSIENNILTCLKAGTTSLIVSAISPNQVTKKIEIKLIIKENLILETELTNDIIYVNQEIELNATINYDAKINYEIDNEELATISNNKLKALKPGFINLKISSIDKEVTISYLIIEELNPILVNSNDEIISKVLNNNEITIQVPAKLKINDTAAKIILNGKEYNPDQEISEIGTYEFLITRTTKFSGKEKQENYKYVVIIKDKNDNSSSLKNIWIYVVSAFAFILILVIIIVIIKTKKSSSMKK